MRSVAYDCQNRVPVNVAQLRVLTGRDQGGDRLRHESTGSILSPPEENSGSDICDTCREIPQAIQAVASTSTPPCCYPPLTGGKQATSSCSFRRVSSVAYSLLTATSRESCNGCNAVASATRADRRSDTVAATSRLTSIFDFPAASLAAAKSWTVIFMTSRFRMDELSVRTSIPASDRMRRQEFSTDEQWGYWHVVPSACDNCCSRSPRR